LFGHDVFDFIHYFFIQILGYCRLWPGFCLAFDGEDVVLTLVDHAQQGVYRPGASERQWLEQAFGPKFMGHVEPGDPYGRPNSPMFQRPNK
jgi:hypothetical protein